MSELPKGWATFKLGDVARFINGRAYKRFEMLDSGTPILRIQNLNGGDNWFYSDLELHDDKYCSKGDLLYAWSATFGPYWARWDRAIYHYHIWKIEEKNGYYKSFAYYQLMHITEALKASSRGVTMPHITKSGMENWEVSIPPLPEQIRIANKLDSILSKVDKAQARLNKIPAILKRFRQSVLAAATSGELTQSGFTSSEWQSVKLIDLVENKPRNGKSPKGVDFDTGIKNLTLSAITPGYFVENKYKFVDLDVPTDSHLWLKNQDILIQRANSIEYVGVSALYEGEDDQYIYPDLIMKCRSNARVLSKYLYYALSSEPVRKYFRDNATGTTGNMPKINQTVVSAAPINLPQIDEQKIIVNKVERLFKKADKLEQQYLDAKARLDRLTQSILAKAFRGELVPQDPNDEPAEQLLERILKERLSQQQKADKPKKTANKRAIKTKVADKG
ncbi:restriction endonuclease subunit S [uncultured Aliivibrio sp.]|uniref:restriction endonuclease subunit S n=1 Tax=uncultured Aliivibrio sp. TaxID=873085 RepID=UPI0026182F2F|nr:restriction endonuclease subunit S [uncultured Aliivibrio sp.]